MIDALILNYNDPETTKACATRLASFSIVNHVLIVDNQSTDDSVEKLSILKSEKIELIISPNNGGYGSGNNLGINYLNKRYSSKYILLCNPDTIIDEKCILALYTFLSLHKDYAIVAPFMLDSNGNKQYNTAFRIPTIYEYITSIGLISNKYKKSFYYNNILNKKCEFMSVGAVSGSLFLMDTLKIINSGMYDDNIFLYCEEITLGIKLKKKGWKTGLLMTETFIHDHSVSINKALKTSVLKHKQLMKSKLYVLKHYYDANPFQYGFALALSQISIFEVWLLSTIRGSING